MSCHSRGRQHAEDTPLRKSVSAKGIWLSIDHSSYYGEVNISGFWPFDTGYLPTLSGFVGSCNLRGYTNVTCSFRDWVSRFSQIQCGTSGSKPGLISPRHFREESAQKPKAHSEGSPHWRLPSRANRHILKGKVLQIRW